VKTSSYFLHYKSGKSTVPDNDQGYTFFKAILFSDHGDIPLAKNYS